jgi:FecR protein/Glucodextranase, domain B
MTRYLIAALLLILGLFAAGYGVRSWLWSDSGAPATLSQPSAADAPRAAEAADSAPVIALSSLRGRVEVRDSPSGDWRPASPNTRLGDDDSLRTDEDSSVVLSIGTGVKVDLSEHSQFALAEVSREQSRLRLETGRVAARVDGDEPSLLQLEVHGNEAVTETRKGAFTVMRAADGNVTVAATAGKVEVQSKQRRFELPAGQQSTVAADGVASAPIQIPSSLFLKVAQTARGQLNRRETQISGTTAPGALVSINGVAAVTSGSGDFTTRVPLKEGANSVTVSAVDALGRVERKNVELDVDTRGPKLGSKVVW